jgi:hypothetical protein
MGRARRVGHAGKAREGGEVSALALTNAQANANRGAKRADIEVFIIVRFR